jgi:2-oxoglutarate dehydrogenase E1 component
MIGNYLHLSNADFVDDLYREWLEDPESVDSDWRAYFQRLQQGLVDQAIEGHGAADPHPGTPGGR